MSAESDVTGLHRRSRFFGIQVFLSLPLSLSLFLSSFSFSFSFDRRGENLSRERVQSRILPAARKNRGLPSWLHRTAPSWVMILPGPTHPIDHRPRRDSYARNHLERARAGAHRRAALRDTRACARGGQPSSCPFPQSKIGVESGPDRDYSRADDGRAAYGAGASNLLIGT